MAEEKILEEEKVETPAEETKPAAKKTTKKASSKTTSKKASKKVEEEKVELVSRLPILKDYEVIKYLIVTEASQKLRDNDNAMVFAVDVKATKLEIKAAVQAIFNAKVKSVNTSKVNPKIRRVGRYSGKLPQYKKAIVRFDSSFDLGKIANEVATEEMAANEEAE